MKPQPDVADILIRPYQSTDRAAVYEIAADTAYFGAPVEAFLDDRRLFNDAFAGYYTRYHAHTSWVAESPGGVAGFLFGCPSTPQRDRQWAGYLVSQVLPRALTRRYRLGRRTASYACAMLAGFVRGEEPHPNLDEYPAHLHINVRDGLRGQGIGRRLIEAYLGQLMQLNVPGVHLNTTSYNLAAWHLYEKMGFILLESHPNRFWTRSVGEGVENRCYGLKL